MKRLLLILFFISKTLFAETYDYSKKWGIGGSAGYNAPIFGNYFSDVADEHTNWGLHLRYHLCSTCGLELAFTRYRFDDVDQDIRVTDLLLFHRLKALSRFTPVIGVGAGVADLTNYDPSSLKLGLKLRAGAEYALNQNLSLGLNIDYQLVSKMFFSNNLPIGTIHVLAAKLGLTWYFGKTQEQSSSLLSTHDSSGDNDNDHDGVLDGKDKCPNTPNGTKVNDYGCAAEEKAIVELNVTFATGKSEIASDYNKDLEKLAVFMEQHPKTKIEIQGHTDITGTKVINKNLSKSRAEAVKKFLVENLKVDANRITAKGYGEEMPIGDNNTVNGRRQNRRAIAIIDEQ